MAFAQDAAGAAQTSAGSFENVARRLNLAIKSSESIAASPFHFRQFYGQLGA
jgi:hypothetical protein